MPIFSTQEDLYENKTNHFTFFNARAIGDGNHRLRYERRLFYKQQ